MPTRVQTTLPAFGPFEHLLDDADRLMVRQDGQAISVGQLRAQAEAFTQRLTALSNRRIALHASRADTVLAGICAAIATSCEIVLVREAYPPEDSFWDTLEVAAVFGEQLELLHSPGGKYRAESAALLLTTSGTTGRPKVAMHEIQKLMGRIRVGPAGDRWLLTYHPASFAGMQVLLTAFCSKALLVAYAGLSAAELVARTLDSGTTHLSGTPTFWRSLLLARDQSGSATRFRQITLGGELADQSTLDALKGAFPEARIIHIYASTEAGVLFAVKDGREGFPAEWLASGIDGCQLRIHEGVLQVQSPRAMRRYCGQQTVPPLTPDGWLITGDLVEVSGDRVLFRGRLDNVINVGGGKVMPEQVEAAIEKLTFIKAVRVYGIKNPLAGLVLAADVVLAESRSEAEVRQEIHRALSQRLEPYKIPRIFKFLDQIATNTVGKKVRTKQ